jgi:hypothetical protein
MIKVVILLAIVIPVVVIGIALGIYHRKYGRLPPVLRGRVGIPNVPTTSAAPLRNRAQLRVWRAEPHQPGLPNYTLQPTGGELSLGTGRKRPSEEYELAETITNTSQHTRETGTTEAEPSPAPRRDTLPPYIPPPAQAVVAAERVGQRRSSRTLLNG